MFSGEPNEAQPCTHLLSLRSVPCLNPLPGPVLPEDRANVLLTAAIPLQRTPGLEQGLSNVAE